MLRRVKTLDYLLIVCTKLVFNLQHTIPAINQGVIMLDKDLKDDYGFQWIDLWDRTKHNKETEDDDKS